MSDEQPPNDKVSHDSECGPLDYQPGLPPRGATRNYNAVAGGFVLAIAILGCAGAGPYLEALLKPQRPYWNEPIVMAYAMIAAASALGTVLMRRLRRALWIDFFLGLFLGATVTALIEGVCFAAS